VLKKSVFLKTAEISGIENELDDREPRTVAGCTMTTSEFSYCQSYNAVSTAASKKKFGDDVFEECAEVARKSWDSKHSTAKGN
jgi:hypothetical protein